MATLKEILIMEIEERKEEVKVNRELRFYLYGEAAGYRFCDKLTTQEFDDIRQLLGITVDEADDLM